ncbi:hypothetical protein CAJAP_02756 [Camponotus japonicus]
MLYGAIMCLYITVYFSHLTLSIIMSSTIWARLIQKPNKTRSIDGTLNSIKTKKNRLIHAPVINTKII